MNFSQGEGGCVFVANEGHVEDLFVRQMKFYRYTNKKLVFCNVYLCIGGFGAKKYNREKVKYTKEQLQKKSNIRKNSHKRKKKPSCQSFAYLHICLRAKEITASKY